jgi:hypothetical protein
MVVELSLARTSHQVSTADDESRSPDVRVAHRAPRHSATTTSSPDSPQPGSGGARGLAGGQASRLVHHAAADRPRAGPVGWAGGGVHDRAKRGHGGRTMPVGDLSRHILIPSRQRWSVQSVFIEAAIGRGVEVRSVLPWDALSQTLGSTFSETAPGLRAHLGPRISASTPCEAGAERRGIPFPQRPERPRNREVDHLDATYQ